MRWIAVVLLCTALAATVAEPEPKKYKAEVKTKEKPPAILTDEERKFLREVEAKFGIKTDLVDDVKVKDVDNNDDIESQTPTKPTKITEIKAPFPAVIAIEIVNDTDTKFKGGNKKRTIDANLGYGYRTNNGYRYTSVGNEQQKGKFMIYPYSQHDIPPAPTNNGYSQQHGHTEVEITPSQAYELVPTQTKDVEPTSYHYEKPAVQLNTKYDQPQGIASPPLSHQAPEAPPTPTTLYTTYNGHQISGLSGQFPNVMSNYLVDSSQLLQNPQYQSAGLTQDYFRSHGANVEQRVVPVLILKIPSSYIKSPSAELYSHQQGYPASQYLHNVNLQELVNQYFQKLGYSHGPQVMAYQNAPVAAPEVPVPTSALNYEPQQYSHPNVQPAYTQADYSGIQYSAVQPVMARYPAGYRQQYYITRGQSLYSQPLQQQQYVYRYQYQQPQQAQQAYYQPQQQQETYAHDDRQEQAVEQQVNVHATNSHVGYDTNSATASNDHLTSHIEYNVQHTQAPEYENSVSATPNYESVDTATSQAELASNEESEEHGYANVQAPNYGTQQSQYQQEQDTIAVYPRSQSGHRYSVRQPVQSYAHQNQVSSEDDHDLVLTENYPSKDHTIATVLPLSYKNRHPTPEPVQAVSYVTPVPHMMKYHSQYRVMVPQTVFRMPTSEKVSYVNSHSLPASYSAPNSEEEYTANHHYVPAISKQKPPLYPRNYHAHPKRMTRPEHKHADTVTLLLKKTEKSKL